jgi:hypothetical protein
MRYKVLILVAAVALAACKPNPPSVTITDPKTGEKSKISTSEKDGNQTVTVEGKGTVSVSASGEAPKNLPAFVPLYPGAKYEGSFATDMAAQAGSDAVKGGMVSFRTDDSADKVLAFYKDALTKANLKETASGDMGGMKMLSFSKGDNEAEGVQVMASVAPTGETQVQLMYSLAP